MEEAWVDARYNPEIDPLPLRGKVSLLGKDYFLPQGKLSLSREFYVSFVTDRLFSRGRTQTSKL